MSRKNYQVLAGNNNEANEAAGRQKTEQLKYIKSMFQNNKEVKLKVKNDNKAKPTRIVVGKVIQKNDYLIAIKTSTSIESFSFIEFLTGRAKIIV